MIAAQFVALPAEPVSLTPGALSIFMSAGAYKVH
jgi:hypothetical protein